MEPGRDSDSRTHFSRGTRVSPGGSSQRALASRPARPPRQIVHSPVTRRTSRVAAHTRTCRFDGSADPRLERHVPRANRPMAYRTVRRPSKVHPVKPGPPSGCALQGTVAFAARVRRSPSCSSRERGMPMPVLRCAADNSSNPGLGRCISRTNGAMAQLQFRADRGGARRELDVGRLLAASTDIALVFPAAVHRSPGY